ncbi:MAG: ubiquinol-cytochrome C chaperone [Methylobacterium mesophilicum]|nr:ubiquinol-cytochrome C chaperone [Methylobacterium mesophilicum]
MLERLFSRKRQANRAIIEALYGQIVAAARQPAFYAQWNVPDTPLGRFEMIGLHVFLVLRRLQDQSVAARDVAQEVTDTFFADIEGSLRDLGIGDLGIPKRVKKLARMFYGRTASYGEALERDDRAVLADALVRNIRPGAARDAEADALASYVSAAAALLAAQPLDGIVAGNLRFPFAGEEIAS